MLWLNIAMGKDMNIFVATWNKLYKVQFSAQITIYVVLMDYMIDDVWFTYQVIYVCAFLLLSCRTVHFILYL